MSALRSRISRECLTSLRRFVRQPTAFHHSSPALTRAKPVKFDAFFLRNDRWASAVAIPASNPLVAETLEANLEEKWQSTQDTVSELPSEGIGIYPPPLSSTAYRPVQALSAKKLLAIYSQLSKANLTTLIVLTAMSSVALSPLPTSVSVLLATASGTALCSASANTLNQLQEVTFDAQMARTRNRPLVRRAISPLHAAGFAMVTGLAGPMILWTCVNPVTALLGAGNIVLYAGLYTYLKRRSVINTWVGAVVGGIPPVMGWTACNGHLLPSAASPVHFFLPPFLLPPDVTALPLEFMNNPLAPFALFMFLFSWQFPHFNSLSHFVRSSYAQAGYCMLSAINPSLNALVALRHALLLIPICSILVPLSGLTTWVFALTSFVPNAVCARYAWVFWRHGGEREARKVFWASLWYLPVMMALMMAHKNGVEWSKWFKSGEKNDRNADQEAYPR